MSFKLDSSAPELSVTEPGARAYAGTETLTLLWTAVDAMSGVDSGKTAARLDDQAVEPGTPVPLYTLNPGSHNFAVTVSDGAGNTRESTVTFSTYADVSSLKALVNLFREKSWIDNHGIANSLIMKLDKGQVEAFLHQVQAQSGKHIQAEAASYLLRNAGDILQRAEEED
ncbi:hypothetical protein J7E73_06630 [Paenibacillus albidus]|uniref:hypothetical protein n=1 Tax=Paenibacillus albidus TaxID=2041023 RepID=UPI001BE92D0F|nr:hypothetical protein [Paenibacillus albidus]MBT2288818.1 hypothetical protein [Paenibacillus albidus]